MFFDHKHNVGFLSVYVGWMSGFLKEPDIGFRRHINGLHGECREWQVFLARESCHEITENNILQFGASNSLIIRDLNDAAD